MLEEKVLIGWNEWCSLPQLAIPAIKAKIDTGAKISAIHAFNLSRHKIHGKDTIKFSVLPLQNDVKTRKECQAEIIDIRKIMSSNGHREERYIILTELHMARSTWKIEMSLSNRDPLIFRMLIGRDALSDFVINPSRSLIWGKISDGQARRMYTTSS